MAAAGRHGVPRRDRRHAARRCRSSCCACSRTAWSAASARTRGSEVDFRIVAATNRDLRALDRAGRVRRRPLRAPRDRHASSCRRCASGSRTCPRSPRTSSRASRARSRTRRSASTRIAPDALAALDALSVAGQHPRAAQRASSRRWSTSARGRDAALRSAEARPARGGERAARARPSIARALAARIARGHDEPARRGRSARARGAREALKRSGGNAARAARLLGAVGRGRSRDPGGTVRADDAQAPHHSDERRDERCHRPSRAMRH